MNTDTELLRKLVELANRPSCEMTESRAIDVLDAVFAARDALSRLLEAREGQIVVQPEDETMLKGMVEAILYGESALTAAQCVMNQRGDFKGASLMQPALDKLRAAMPSHAAEHPPSEGGARE